MWRVIVDVTVRLILNVNDTNKKVHIEDILDDMDYEFSYAGKEADITDMEITDFEVVS